MAINNIYVQYQNATRTKALCNGITNELYFSYIVFCENYLNIQTASSDGLELWGQILGQSRLVKSYEAYDYVFGFAQAIPTPNDVDYPQNFHYSNFFNPLYSPTVALSDSEYRAILYLLYRSRFTNSSLYSLNQIIQAYEKVYLDRGVPSIKRTAFMELTYFFPYALGDLEIIAFRDTNLLPRPAGYNINIITL